MASVNAITQVGVARSLTWFEVAKASQFIAVRNPWASLVYGIPRGGLPVAGFTGLPMVCPQVAGVLTPDYLASMYGTDELLIVDDLADSGRTPTFGAFSLS